jgi:hypothetical protein
MELKKLADITRQDLRGLMSPATLRRKVFAREIPHRVIAHRIFIEESVLEELLRGREVPAKDNGQAGAP